MGKGEAGGGAYAVGVAFRDAACHQGDARRAELEAVNAVAQSVGDVDGLRGWVEGHAVTFADTEGVGASDQGGDGLVREAQAAQGGAPLVREVDGSAAVAGEGAGAGFDLGASAILEAHAAWSDGDGVHMAGPAGDG